MLRFLLIYTLFLIPCLHAQSYVNPMSKGVMVQVVSVPLFEQMPGYQSNQRTLYFLRRTAELFRLNHRDSVFRDSVFNLATSVSKIPSLSDKVGTTVNKQAVLQPSIATGTKQNIDISELSKTIQQVETLIETKITVLDLDIGLLHFQCTNLDKWKVFLHTIEILFNENWRLKVQYGADVSRRQRVPNDPEFNQQKYLQSIQMPDAWDYGVSSVTRAGDTAVIAIIDDGVDTGHIDLVSNLYRNYKEIPWNGIDEDSNGYVDDYWGWNGGDNSPLIFNRESTRYGHGTAVASAMMAKGDNNKGITGLLWDTKLMITHCYPTNGGAADVGVVNTMIYLFNQKKLYLNTGGRKGANIVAVNMSVGVDNAFPFEFPIWCSMYDSLVSVGIMCASSTTNLNIDVDDPSKGDIPSLCPSKGLIVVSSADENKNRASSGYGAVSVDLHATGQSMYLAKPTQTHSYPYAMESGTSFASPQVTATIAWLYSRSCHTYLNLWRNNPDSAVLLMRKWILSSTQQNATLTGKSTSGGYLQVLSAWEKMHQWCSANDNAYSTKTIQPKSLALYPNPIASDKLILDGIRISNPNLQTISGMHARLLNVAGNVVSDLRIDNYNFGEDSWMVIKSETVLAPGYYQITLSNSQTQENYYLPIVITDN